MYMKDAYTTLFYDAVTNTKQTHGYTLPEHIEVYLVALLAENTDRPDFLPTKSFAESFLSANTPRKKKEFADTCLFVSGVFPYLGEKRGINRSYYRDMGTTSYEMLSEHWHPELFSQLAQHFDFLAQFIEVVFDSNGRKIINFQ